jgi:EF-P beta-lysylation protein EpmB
MEMSHDKEMPHDNAILKCSDASTSSWQAQIRDAIKDPEELLRRLNLDPALLSGARQADKLFPLRAPQPYVSRIHPGNANDPLLLQLLPQLHECQEHDGGVKDPLREQIKLPVAGLMHKYRDRVLLLTTSVCAGHCRYCFRRHFPYAEQQLRDNLDRIRDYIRGRDEIKEVILSGGDPLSAGDKRIARLISALEEIPHLSRLRIHTRMPIFVPGRVTTSLLKLLKQSRLTSIVVIHCNHPNEIDSEVSLALRKLSQHTTLLNQSVLLSGVNDNCNALVTLSERLFSCGVLPYYLHMMDAVRGAGAFHVNMRRARRLMGEVAANLPGYLVPRLVKEYPGRAAKQVLAYELN